MWVEDGPYRTTFHSLGSTPGGRAPVAIPGLVRCDLFVPMRPRLEAQPTKETAPRGWWGIGPACLLHIPVTLKLGRKPQSSRRDDRPGRPLKPDLSTVPALLGLINPPIWKCWVSLKIACLLVAQSRCPCRSSVPPKHVEAA